MLHSDLPHYRVLKIDFPSIIFKIKVLGTCKHLIIFS